MLHDAAQEVAAFGRQAELGGIVREDVDLAGLVPLGLARQAFALEEAPRGLAGSISWPER